MDAKPAPARRCRGAWALSEPSAVLLWQLGMGWSVLAAAVDASTGRRIVLSGFVLIGPCCVLLTGRWLRTALAGAWATCLVVVLGLPDGIWGTRLETYLICLAVLVAVSSTLALVITLRSGVSLAVTALLAAGCGSSTVSPARRPAEPIARPVSCRRQYEAWKRGPASAEDSRLEAAVRAVRTAEKSGNAIAIRSAMKKLMPAAVATGRGGAIPQCADPDYLYDRYVTGIYQVGYNARLAKGLGGLLKAADSLKEMKAIESQLTAEVHRALAKN
jgi:hypothetical protein